MSSLSADTNGSTYEQPSGMQEANKKKNGKNECKRETWQQLADEVRAVITAIKKSM